MLEEMASICSEVIMNLDGSGLNGQIVVAAVLHKGGMERGTLRKHLGNEEQHTMFEAELLGLSLAAELIKAEAHVQSVFIGVDSQAAILTTRHTRGMPGQHLVNVFHDQMHAIHHKHPGIDTVLRWTPGHCDLAGNECADEEAKRVAQGTSSPLHQLPVSCRREPPVIRSARYVL